jgi:monoamine oxidase
VPCVANPSGACGKARRKVKTPAASEQKPTPNKQRPRRPGFLAGERGDAVAAIGDAEAARRFVAQLDDMFGSASDPKPASSSLVRYEVFDWSKVEWVGGAYSYPTFGAEAGDREALAAPVGGTLFFAGEATHPDVNPCMQAALESGETAAVACLKTLSFARSRL